MNAAQLARERQAVELVDETGRAIGSSSVAAAHSPPGQLHRAFSVVLLDSAGRFLLQRRAETKLRFPGHWANACCGHVAPGGQVVETATRRLAAELGLRGVALTQLATFVYRAVDPSGDQVEHEYDHVLFGRSDAEPCPAPDEVCDWTLAEPSRLDVRRPVVPWMNPLLRTVGMN